MENVAWCYMNNRESAHLKSILSLLEPGIFEDISDKTYEWMRRNQILMSYIIMGEFFYVQEYLKQIATADNVEYIQELQKKLERTGKL